MKEILNQAQTEQFEKCYAIYARKGSVGQARKTWAKWSFDETDTRKIFQAIIAQNRARRAKPIEKTFLPLFSSWLNAEQWDDPIESEGENKPRGELGKCKCGEPVNHAREGLCDDCRHQLSRIEARKEIAEILEKMGIYNPGDTRETLNAKCKKYLTENRKDVIYNLSVKDD